MRLRKQLENDSREDVRGGKGLMQLNSFGDSLSDQY